MKKKGFLGLGVMGFHMAGHLSKMHPTAIYNRTSTKSTEWLSTFSGSLCESPEQLGEQCDEIYLCIGNDDDVREVVCGGKGILQSMKPGGIIVDHTTTSSSLSHEMNSICLKKGINYIDAPVSGGQLGAEKGVLTIMAGGDEKSFQKIKSTLDCYAKFSKLMGPSGTGQKTKMVNQICIAGLLQGLAEGIFFSEKAGLNLKEVIDVISKGAAQSWQMENRWETMSKDHYDHGFAVDHMRKDLNIAIDEANKNGFDLEITTLVDQFYKEVQTMGGGRWDTSSLLKRLHFNE